MTAPHISDELPRMLTGEADRDAVLSAASHLRDCIDCQHELVSALVAHASLTSAHRFAPEIVTGPLTGNFTDAADAVHDADTPIPLHPSDGPLPALDLAAARHAVEDDHAAVPPAVTSLPDLSAVFAQVRAEAEADKTGTPVPIGNARSARSASNSGRTRYLVGAAAAAVIVGAAGVVYGFNSGTDTTDNSTFAQGRTVQLAAYGVGKTPATAKVGDGTLSLNATSLPKLAGKRYEVWLTNDGRTAMQPVGWIGRDGKAAMTVPVDLLTKFTDVEVSVQNLDADDYVYSGVSVLRGALT